MATDAPQQQPPPDPSSNPEPVANSQEPSTTTSNAPASAPADREASPPLPTAPIPLTPGPRASRLQEVFSSSLNATLSKLSYTNVSSCYPTIATKAPSTLRSIQGQMVSVLQSRCEKEFAGLLERWRVVERLNELEGLISQAERRRGDDGAVAPIAPHLLPPEQIVAAHLAPALASQQSQLNARLQTMQSHNVALFEEIRAQREAARRMLDAVERILADVEGANGLLDEVVGELAEESRAVGVEMEM